MRTETIHFADLAASSANKTLVSKRIDVKYRIKRMKLFFDSGCDLTVKIYPFISKDPEAPTTAPPAGQNIIGEFSQSDFVYGDAQNVEFVLDHAVIDKGTYIKLYITNSAVSTPHIMGNVSIEIDD